jgi:hypothetical protein
LSRHRRIWDWYPTIRAIPDSRWAGASDYDWSISWRAVDFVRPPLELLPLARVKAAADGFVGTMLVPQWQGRIWYRQLSAMAFRCRSIRAPDKNALHGKSWGAVLMSFSPEAAAKLSRLLHSSRPLFEVLSPGQESDEPVQWQRGPA